MRKTLLFTTDYPPSRGGVARYLSNFARFFADRVEVVVPDAGHRRWWSAAYWLWWHRVAYDRILVSHVLPLGTAAMVSGWVTRVPYVVIVHGMDIGFAKRSIVKKWVAGQVLRGAELVVANSKALEREVRDDFSVTRMRTVYPCMDVTEVPVPIRTHGPVRLLTVSRLVSRKGQMRVLDALSRLRDAHPELSLAYTIVGDGPMRRSIEDRVAQTGLTDVCIVPDATDAQVQTFYASADLLVMPVVRDDADREGFGMVYLEAALHGVPSIATDMPGVDEAVLHGKTGLLVPDGDVAALADAVYRLATDAALRQRLGEAARARTRAEFTCDAQFSALRGML